MNEAELKVASRRNSRESGKIGRAVNDEGRRSGGGFRQARRAQPRLSLEPSLCKLARPYYQTSLDALTHPLIYQDVE